MIKNSTITCLYFREDDLARAANQDAIAEPDAVGIGAQQAMTYAATDDGLRAAQLVLSDAVLSLRGTGQARVEPPEGERRKTRVH